MSQLNGVIATSRFGYGAIENELLLANKSPKSWLIKQLSQQPAVTFDEKLPHSNDVFAQLFEYRKLKRAQKKAQTKDMSLAEDKKIKNPARKFLIQFSADTLMQAIQSNHSLNWRLLDFFSNHFSVTAAGPVMAGIAPTLEREAIAPNLLGNFEDILLSVTQHPAMLIYLNNEKSFGPHSRLGKRGLGLNENLAREILELHTLGVNSGYQQSDVIALAKGITGWSVARPKRNEGQGFVYRVNGHEPGSFTLLGKSYSAKNQQQGINMLKDLANHPKTARHLCYKLAHHFISDTPSEKLLAQLTRRWMATKGNIKEVMITLINSDEAWQAQKQKFKSPREFFISSLRALNINDATPYLSGKKNNSVKNDRMHKKTHRKPTSRKLINTLTELGQRPFNAGSPAGYSDKQEDWDGSSALMAKIDWIANLASKMNSNAETILNNTLGDTASELTYNMVLRAESREKALTLLLMSPELVRR